MYKSKYFFLLTSSNKLTNALTWLYFIIGSIEIVAEFYNDTEIIWLTKPFLLPGLMFLYCKTSKKPNPIFLVALGFNWVANICFIFEDFKIIIFGASFFLIHIVLIIYLLIKLIKFPGKFPLLLCSLPFLFLHLCVANLANETSGYGICLFVIQGVFLIFMGGFVLANYMLKSNKINFLLLISTIFFLFTQFIIILKYYYISFKFFQPLAMLLFVIGQYIFYKFLILNEKRNLKYEIINNPKLKNS